MFVFFFFFFKQKTAYEMRISDWSSDVCSSDLSNHEDRPILEAEGGADIDGLAVVPIVGEPLEPIAIVFGLVAHARCQIEIAGQRIRAADIDRIARIVGDQARRIGERSEEHTSELQSLMRNSYAVFCLTK